jgi:hypothetical protein
VTQKQMMTPKVQEVKAMMRTRSDYLAPMMRQMLQQVLEGEMEAALGARKGERTIGRLGYRSGYYNRTLVTRVGKIELQVPQDRDGRFSTEVFDRYQRSEKALVSALAEMYIQGVSTRKVKEITEQLWEQKRGQEPFSSGHSGYIVMPRSCRVTTGGVEHHVPNRSHARLEQKRGQEPFSEGEKGSGTFFEWTFWLYRHAKKLPSNHWWRGASCA